MVSFADMSKMDMSQIIPPPPLPEGDYNAECVGPPEESEFVSKDGENFVRLTYQFRIIEHVSGAIPELLEKFGEVRNARVRRTFLFNESNTKDALLSFNREKLMLREHLEVNESSPEECRLSCAGNKCGVTVKHKANKANPDNIFVEVVQTSLVHN